jgi:protein O-mannosyl-transferase
MSTPLQRDRQTATLAALGLAAITVAAYLPALRGGFIWDDQEFVTNNTVLNHPEGLWKIWFDPATNREPHYWPMTYSSLWLDTQLWGVCPMTYHLTNVLLHALNAVLVWRLLRRLAVPGAWAAAALFALHPAHVESVAWIIERKDVLSGAFYLAALLAYLHFDRARRGRVYTLALVLFVGALLSKSMAVSLPPVIALALWWDRGQLQRSDLLRLAPFFGVATALAVLDLRLTRELDAVPFALTPLEHGLLAGRAWWFYVVKSGWPWSLVTIYPRWAIDTHDAWAYAYPTAAIMLVIVSWLARRRVGRWLFCAVAFFALTLGPILGLVEFGFMKYAWVADRFLYLAVLAPLALVASGAARAAARPTGKTHAMGPLALAAVLALLGSATWRQCGLYENDTVFWQAQTDRNPQAWAGHYNLGVALAQGGRAPEEVIPHLRRALQLKPDLAEAHNRWGMEEARRNALDAAIEQFGEAVRLDPQSADAVHNLVRARHQRALELVRAGQLDAAIVHFREALRVDPGQTEVRFNLAVALAQSGRQDEAVRELDDVLQRTPGDTQARALRARWAAEATPRPATSAPQAP